MTTAAYKNLVKKAVSSSNEHKGIENSADVLSYPNIDLNHRPIVHNSDGSISTVRSATFQGDDGNFVLLPTVVGGKVVSNDAAWQNYVKTGEHLGTYRSEEAADKFANQIHNAQANRYVITKAAKNRLKGQK